MKLEIKLKYIVIFDRGAGSQVLYYEQNINIPFSSLHARVSYRQHHGQAFI